MYAVIQFIGPLAIAIYRSVPFLRATNFANGLKEVRGNYFPEST